jgi:hypothetical protein
VWEEARKALEATSLTSGLGIYSYMIRQYERDLDPQGSEVMSEESRIQQGVMESPFRSLDVDSLLSRGFIHGDDDGSTFYAPDADVLLSDPFLDTHCMSLTEGGGEAEGLLGLSFRPTEDRGVLDISGVLWLDPENAELQWLDYRYEFLDFPDAERLGGQVRFEGLPNGTWIVSEWYIRTPLVEVRRRGQLQLVGLREEGGSILSVSNLQGDLVLDLNVEIIETLPFSSTRSYKRAPPPPGHRRIDGDVQDQHEDAEPYLDAARQTAGI